MTTETKDKIRKWTLDLGKVDANGRGRKANRVTLDVELSIKREATVLSICGAVWNAVGSDHQSGGQCEDEIARLFPGNASVLRLVEIWKVWHLNDMKAGCSHQRAEGWDKRAIDTSKPTNTYIDHPGGGQGWNMCAWVSVDRHPEGLLGKPCSTCGYKYGTAWLVEALPAEVEAEVVALCGALSAKTAAATSGQDDPKNFAEEHGITATSVSTDRNHNLEEAKVDMMDHWKVTLRRGKARMTVIFSKGLGHHGVKPTAIEVLGNMASDASSADESFEDWCANYGYETDSRKAEKTFKAVKKQAVTLKRFLGDGLFQALLEDSNG